MNLFDGRQAAVTGSPLTTVLRVPDRAAGWNVRPADSDCLAERPAERLLAPTGRYDLLLARKDVLRPMGGAAASGLRPAAASSFRAGLEPTSARSP